MGVAFGLITTMHVQTDNVPIYETSVWFLGAERANVTII